MRIITLLCLFGTLADVAIAQTAEQCQSMQRAGDLLDCYNGTAPLHCAHQAQNVQSFECAAQTRVIRSFDCSRKTSSFQNSYRPESAVRR